MKRKKEEYFQCPTLPNDVWREILSSMSITQKMVFSQTTKQNSILALESVTTLRVSDFVFLGNSVLDFSSRLGDSQLSRFYQLRELDLSGVNTITDRGLRALSCLQNLNLECNDRITGKSVKKLITLTKLNLTLNDVIYSRDLMPLINLTSLSLSSNGVIESWCLPFLTSLRDLSLDFNDTILDRHLSSMTGLTSLSLRSNRKIHTSLLSLTNLTKLTLSYSRTLLDDGILSVLTSLQILSINNLAINGDCLQTLTNLRELSLSDLPDFQYHYLTRCVNLTTLRLPLYHHSDLSDSTLAQLTNLITLDLGFGSSKSITLETISSLKRLKFIALHGYSFSFDIERLSEFPNLSTNRKNQGT